ncbi:MAG: START domain-containing protein [Ekhidna sp.]
MKMEVNWNLVLLLGASFLMTHKSAGQNAWEIDKKESGIVVYTKAKKGSVFKAFKAVTSLKASADEIMEVLKNADDYARWYGYTKTSKLLRHEKDIQYNYVETIFPWPYRNRDMVYKMSIKALDSGVVKISLNGLPDYIPAKKGVVRMKKAEGYILLQSLGTHTDVIYVFHSEPGDNVPGWLANNSIAELPFKTLLGLKRVLKENKIP